MNETRTIDEINKLIRDANKNSKSIENKIKVFCLKNKKDYFFTDGKIRPDWLPYTQGKYLASFMVKYEDGREETLLPDIPFVIKKEELEPEEELVVQTESDKTEIISQAYRETFQEIRTQSQKLIEQLKIDLERKNLEIEELKNKHETEFADYRRKKDSEFDEWKSSYKRMKDMEIENKLSLHDAFKDKELELEKKVLQQKYAIEHDPVKRAKAEAMADFWKDPIGTLSKGGQMLKIAASFMDTKNGKISSAFDKDIENFNGI